MAHQREPNQASDATNTPQRQFVDGNETLFEELLEGTPDALLIVGADGRILLANTQAEVLFGYRREELLNQPIELLIPERFRDEHLHHRAMYLADARTRPMGSGLELLGRRKDGSEFPLRSA